MKKVLAALCMIVLFCIVFLSISGCTEEEKTEEANQSNYGKQQCFEHNFGMYLVEIAPTCTEKGTESAYCAVCGEKSVREIQPLGHDLEGLPCEGRHCSRCEYTEAPTAHVYELIEEIPADCLYAGIKIYSCECGESYTEEVPASGHAFGEWQVSTPSTCIKEGVEKRVCERCLAEETRSLPLAEHDFGEWTATVSPTCTEPGSKNRACSVCGHTETAEIPAVGHKYVLVEERPATCAENGKKIFECSVCHDIKEEITEDNLNHDFGEALPCEEGVVCVKCGVAMPTAPHTCATRGKEATCTESGYTETYCTVCEKVIGERTESAALGHDFGEWETDIAATCVAEGVEKRVCIRCGAEETRNTAVAEHNFSEWVITRAPTCTEPGVQTRVCASCGISETRAIPVTEHEWEEVFVLPATETSEGKTTYKCSICHAVKEETIPKIEHVHDYDYVSINGVGVACSCGRVNANEGNVIIDSSNTVSGICEGSGNVIVVPNTAYAVNWELVFCYNSQIEYIYFGENITAIDNLFAFEGCDNLKAIYVSSECSIPVVPDIWPDMEIIRVDYNS